MRHVKLYLAFAPGLALGFALAGAAAAANDEPPKLDVEATCKSAQKADVRVSDNSSMDGCLRSERAAHDELKRRWKDFTPAAKKQCADQFQAGGYPSYVETVTCLELATGTPPGGRATEATGRAGGSSDPAASKGSKLTDEPSPKQRTNPIEVLDRK